MIPGLEYYVGKTAVWSIMLGRPQLVLEGKNAKIDFFCLLCSWGRSAIYFIKPALCPAQKAEYHDGRHEMEKNSAVLSHFSCIQLFATLWTVAHQAPLSMGFSRLEYWSGLPCPPPGDVPTQGSNLPLLCLLHWQTGSLPLVSPRKPMEKSCFGIKSRA